MLSRDKFIELPGILDREMFSEIIFKSQFLYSGLYSEFTFNPMHFDGFMVSRGYNNGDYRRT